MKILIAIIIFSIIILFHELGHFLLAKANGIKVNEFSLGLGPTIVGFTKGETKYSLKLLPFGGACMMEGEDEGSDDSRAFNNKSVLARISVVAAGPVFNFIMAFIFSIILIACVGYDKPQISGVMEGYPADAAGMQADDTIVKMNNMNIHFYSEVSTYLMANPGATVDVVYERGGEKYETVLQPKLNDETGTYMIGIQYAYNRERTGVLGTIKYAAYEVKYWIWSTIEGLKMLGKGTVSVKEMSGPVGIVQTIGNTYEQSSSVGAFEAFLSMLNIAILLSANLGVMNLLPLPALDGGRLVFLIIEGIRRKKIDPNKEGMVHFVGIVLLMILMVVVMVNDIHRII